jgi:hypothetical protein
MPYLDENYKRINTRIADAYAIEYELAPEICKDIAFHMTDWLDDFEELKAVFGPSKELTTKQILETVNGFLIHASNHIAAAKKLAGYGPMEDIFQVGILEEDEMDKTEPEEA